MISIDGNRGVAKKRRRIAVKQRGLLPHREASAKGSQPSAVSPLGGCLYRLFVVALAQR